VYLKSVIPSVKIDLKYFGKDNFTGNKINGYRSNRCIISNEAASALKHVQMDLSHFRYGLKVFDAYRPQRSVDDFVKWSRNNNRKMKKVHYPKLKKKNLFKEGYIATKSGHSRGSTVDLTIIDFETGLELDMGTCYDFFGEESWLTFENLNEKQKQNRLLLHSVMKKYGFKSLKSEWWHFTLHNEPFPKKYFNFIIN
jgi:D-alanyl-D-alanine dipeptidase|tara:strand:- start:19854 stop:20444 length:591 start_codon:yes stop_codon:yes gene_type:complete